MPGTTAERIENIVGVSTCLLSKRVNRTFLHNIGKMVTPSLHAFSEIANLVVFPVWGISGKHGALTLIISYEMRAPHQFPDPKEVGYANLFPREWIDNLLSGVLTDLFGVTYENLEFSKGIIAIDLQL